MTTVSKLILLIPLFIFSSETVNFKMFEQKKINTHPDTTIIEAWFTIDSSDSQTAVALPELEESDQYRVISSEATQSNSSSIRVVNGNRTSNTQIKHQFRYILELIPAGTLNIPELEAVYKNEVYRSNPLQVKHSSSNQMSTNSRTPKQEISTEYDPVEIDEVFANREPSTEDMTSIIKTLTTVLLVLIGGVIGLVIVGFVIGVIVRRSVTSSGKDSKHTVDISESNKTITVEVTETAKKETTAPDSESIESSEEKIEEPSNEEA